MGAELPTSWPALVGYGILAVFLAWNGWLQSRRTRHVTAVAEEVREQVRNSHSTNLREELDERHDELLDALSELKAAIGDLDRRTGRIGDEVIQDRKDLNALRRDSYSAIRRLDGIAAKHHPEEG